MGLLTPNPGACAAIPAPVHMGAQLTGSPGVTWGTSPGAWGPLGDMHKRASHSIWPIAS